MIPVSVCEILEILYLLRSIVGEIIWKKQTSLIKLDIA